MTIFTAYADGRFVFAEREVRCSLGRAGVLAEADKRERDGATPLGRWLMRRVLYRPDRGGRPATALPIEALTEQDGWCDDPADRAYNRRVPWPYPASAEQLWRGDGLYDLLVVLAFNDSPPVAGRGSAIFLHCASESFGPTRGCVALARSDLEAALKLAGPGSVLEVKTE